MIEIIGIAFVFVGVLFGVCYITLIAMYCYGWTKTSSYNVSEFKDKPNVSIVIAARNEELSIIKCIQSVLKQNYPKEQYEIIVVDDHSTDATFQLVSTFAEKNKNVKIVKLLDAQTGKKNAIESGIKQASGEIILTTDADCTMGEQWLQTMVSSLVQSANKMVIGPVDYTEEKSLLGKFQTLELIALMASGAGSLYYNLSTLCSGANLAYYKKTFEEVNGYDGIKSIASGDDVLLMYKIKKAFPKQTAFVKNKDAIVYTKAKATLKEFYYQRKRWGSKGFSILNAETKFVASVVLGFNSSILIMLLISLLTLLNIPIDSYFIFSTCILFGIKWFIDFLLLFLATSFFNKRKLLIYFLPEQLFYSFYILIVGLFGSFGKYEWKGRKIKL